MVLHRIRLSTGVEIACSESGPADAPPVLLLHAWGETRGVFDELVPLLEKDLRVLAPDQRGAGASDKPATGYSLGDLAADVVAMLDALGVEAAWILGTSSGGYLAQQVAVERPERCRGLVLVGSPKSLRGPGPFGAFLAELTDPVTVEDVERLDAAIPVHHLVEDDVRRRRAQDATTIPAHVWRATYDGLREATPPTEAGVIRAPTLILWGGADDLLPSEQLAGLAESIPQARLRVYDGTGHLVLLERPGQVAADVAAFVSEHEAKL